MHTNTPLSVVGPFEAAAPPDNSGRTTVPQTGPDYAIAEFIDPVGFAWTESQYEVRQAIKQYCEMTDADY
jgi:hypothetical protein